MKIKVPSDRLPNSQSYQQLIANARQALIEISIKQLIESGIANSAYARGLNFFDTQKTVESINHFSNMVHQHLLVQCPYIDFAKGGYSEIVLGGATGLGIGYSFIFKDSDIVYKSMNVSARSFDTGTATSREVGLLGVPKWLNRYVGRLNRLCFENKIPMFVSLSVRQYVPDYGALRGLSPIGDTTRPNVSEAFVKAIIHFDPVIMVEDKSAYEQFEHAYGKFARNRNPMSSTIGYFCQTRSAHEDTLDKPITGVVHSMPLPSVVFFVKHFVQIIKTLHRKAEYVSSVFAVKL